MIKSLQGVRKWCKEEGQQKRGCRAGSLFFICENRLLRDYSFMPIRLLYRLIKIWQSTLTTP